MIPIWTNARKLAALMDLPWEVAVSRSEDDAYFVATVRGLPDVIATGTDDRALARDLWDSLYASLEARLDEEESLVLPRGAQLPWRLAPPDWHRRHQIDVIVRAPHGIMVTGTASGAPGLALA